jgi:hypothetical protein
VVSKKEVDSIQAVQGRCGCGEERESSSHTLARIHRGHGGVTIVLSKVCVHPENLTRENGARAQLRGTDRCCPSQAVLCCSCLDD